MNTYTGYTIVTATQDFFKRYVDFSGRSTLSAYWYWMLANVIITSVLTGLDYSINGNVETGPLSNIWYLATLIPSFALGFRRLHDIGKSAWNYLWVFLPIVGWIILFIYSLKDSQADNQWGKSEKYPSTDGAATIEV